MLPRRAMLRAAPTLVVFGITAAASVALAQPAPPPAAPPVEGEPAPPPAVDAATVEALRARIEALEAAARTAPPAAATTPAPVAAEAAELRVPAVEDDGAHRGGFRFGSYGRVVAGTDLRGGKPAPVHVAAHGPRVVEQSYLELDLAYAFAFDMGGTLRTVTTLAYDDQLFHDSGEFTAGPAIRNLYAEATLGDFSGWVGSRMLRGDDLYLFDYWPLDDLNTVGAGAAVTTARLEVSGHVGVNRLRDRFQYQERQVADPELGATTVVQLNRQRMIASARAGYTMAKAPTALSTRARLYGELHGLPSGTRRRESDATLEALPQDWGTTLGLELSAWGLAPAASRYRRHANLFVRWSRGLAAFDELAAPTSFDAELRTFPKASEVVVGAGANWDDAWGHVMFAAYARRFVDADVNVHDRDDGWEYAVDVRPAVKLQRRGLYAALDLAYEARFPRGLQPTTQLAADAAIVSIAPMLSFHPTGPSAFDRPELRVIYRAAHQNDGALALYPVGDPRARAWTHYLGVEAEWWFNSNSYR